MDKVDHSLNTPWKIWYHSITDNNWKNNSYKMVYQMNNLLDVNLVIDKIQSNHLQNSMFFIMRNDMFPTWEYVDNREGCCISFKIPGSDLKKHWDFILKEILTENIFTDKDKHLELNGFSISPKKEFNIIKFWLKNDNKNYDEFIKEYEPFFVKKKSIHKKHF